MSPRVHLVIIDPQNDFCDPNGSLAVPGAKRDMERLAHMIERLKAQIGQIHVSLDAHHRLDISHPLWWQTPGGHAPDPFTPITADDLVNGRYRTRMPDAYDRSLKYLETLERTARFGHVVWPFHCLIGDEGQTIEPVLGDAIHAWEERLGWVNHVHKGTNPWTEHFSLVQAQVPMPEDPSTHANLALVHTLESADIILVAGEALSHCVAHSVRDIAKNFRNPASIKKMVLLSDATQSVPGFEPAAEAFVREMKALGMHTATTSDVLK